jgi:hypothetical protein
MPILVRLAELEQRLMETNTKLDGQPFPLDHLYNLVAHCCPGPFTEIEAVEVAPILGRVLSITQVHYLLSEAKQVCQDAADGTASLALDYIEKQMKRIGEETSTHTAALQIAANPDWGYRYSLAPQGALLLALLWSVLPPGELPGPIV